jgi:hypothetical protein
MTQTGTSVIGAARVAGIPDAFALNGTHNYPNVNLQGNAFGFAVMFSGTFNGSNSIAGTLSSPGQPSQPVTIIRQ